MTKFYVDAGGSYLGGYDGPGPVVVNVDGKAVPLPEGAVEVPSPPPLHNSQTWNGAVWSAFTPPLDPDAELDAALAEVKARLSNVSTVADVVTALNDMLDAMRGQAGRAGRIAGRPV